MTEEPPFPQITPPSLTDKGTDLYVEGTTLEIGSADNGKYTNITLEQIKEKIKGVTTVYFAILEISGDVVLHVTGNIWLGQGCEIILKKNASLTLYVDGDITCGNDGGIGYEDSSRESSRIRIYATGEGEQDFDLKAKNDWTGVVYAPNANIDVFAKGDVYGAFVGYDFEFKADGNLHYDEVLREVSVNDEGVRFVVKRWQEE